MKEPFIIVITGPAGAGKSTVAAALAKQTARCVNIEVDHIKHFIAGGFIYDDSREGIAQWDLLGENIKQLAKNYLGAGYNVIVNGYLNEQAWNSIGSHIIFTNKFLLLPSLTKVHERDNNRAEDVIMGNEATQVHHHYFSNSEFYKNFSIIDSSEQSVLETVGVIEGLIHSSK